MPTPKARINISVSGGVKTALTKLAHRDHVPTATKAARLIEQALEMEEDQVWDRLASRRDTKNARYRSHRSAWR